MVVYDAGSARNLYMNNIRDILIRSIQYFFSLFKYEKNATQKKKFYIRNSEFEIRFKDFF